MASANLRVKEALRRLPTRTAIERGFATFRSCGWGIIGTDIRTGVVRPSGRFDRYELARSRFGATPSPDIHFDAVIRVERDRFADRETGIGQNRVRRDAALACGENSP